VPRSLELRKIYYKPASFRFQGRSRLTKPERPATKTSFNTPNI